MAKRYKVVGTQPIDDGTGKSHNPGEEFSADYEVATEEFLVGIGALEVLGAKDEKTKNAKGKDEKGNGG